MGKKAIQIPNEFWQTISIASIEGLPEDARFCSVWRSSSSEQMLLLVFEHPDWPDWPTLTPGEDIPIINLEL